MSRRKRTLFAALNSALALPLMFSAAAHAQEATPPAAASDSDDEIIITGTRREISIQDVPVNIAAVSAAQIQEQNIGDMTELAGSIPGLHIVDTGGNSASPVIARGINADPLSANDGSTDGGGTVGIYLGDIPLVIDLRFDDMDRVEVLMGPQGTLYGAGTLAGAIRYIPRKPEFGNSSITYNAEGYGYAEGDGISSDIGTTFNIPVASNFAIRGTVNRLEDKGFIDYDYVVKDIGVSDADPDFSNPSDVAANLSPVKDANSKDVLSGRVAARWEPMLWWDATLAYDFQSGFVGGRQISSARSTLATPDWVSAKRVRETFERDNDLVSLEQTFKLGFADLTSSTGYTRLFDRSQRDQTDLLILLNPAASSYYYDNFPTFTAITSDHTNEKAFTQELRLVSSNAEPWTWLAGVFYSDFRQDGFSKEFTPHFSQYLFDTYGGGDVRPDDLEYDSVTYEKLIEEGVFGELGLDVTPKWNVSLGGRWYRYDLRTRSATDFPLLNTAYFGAGPTDITLDFEPANQKDDGFLWKFNTSYKFTDEVMTYFTRSEGFRIGNSNGLEACTGGPGQTVCASPGEEAYGPDTTVNYEMGARTRVFDHRLTLNGSVFHIDWQKPQVSSGDLGRRATDHDLGPARNPKASISN